MTSSFLLFKNKSVVLICVLGKDIVACTIFKELGLCCSFSVLSPAWFPRCARFNGVEERKGFLYKVDFVACADLAASVSTPLPPDLSCVQQEWLYVCIYQPFKKK